jgi:hypothetical protein
MAGAARKLVGDTGGKPIMIYRPIVLNGTWPCPSRSPDPVAYAALYRSIKDRFFTVSVCNLDQKGEHIVGEEQDADLKLHHGEADFETLAGLFAEARLSSAMPASRRSWRRRSARRTSASMAATKAFASPMSSARIWLRRCRSSR